MLAAFSVEGGPAIVLARGVADMALLSACGALLSRAWLAPPVLNCLVDAGPVARLLARVGWFSLAACVLLTVVWLALQSAAMAGSAASLPLVLRETLFGHLVLARLGLLGLAALLFARRWLWPAALAAGAAVLTQAGHGHGLAMYEGPSWLLLSDALHVLVAAAWLGSLVPLAVLIAAVPPREAALAARRFSGLGTASVAVLAGTALFQGSVLVGSLPGWIGTGYGLVALAKTALFLVLLTFAARNRFRLTPALAGAVPTHAKARLVRSIAGETGVGVLVVLAAGLLTGLPPAMHEQPNWPLPWRLSFEAVREDESLRREALLAGAVLVGAVVIAGVALLRRSRARLLVTACAIIAAVLAGPHLEFLLVEAYPTQYWRSPTGFASSSIADGAVLFRAHCAGCHGVDGRGDGPAAKGAPVPPADLTAEHLWAHVDGELFWWISQGIPTPDGATAMPGFAATLTADQRWALIDWVRANNAGVSRTATGSWPRPVQAPGMEATCEGGQARTLEDLRGDVLRIVFGPATPLPGVITLQVTSDRAARPADRLCLVADGAAPLAYQTVTGLASERLVGAEVLVDGSGWLRMLQEPDAKPEPGALGEMIRSIQAHPLTAGPTGHAGMRM